MLGDECWVMMNSDKEVKGGECWVVMNSDKGVKGD